MYWYAGKTSSISSPSELLRGFPCNPICHIYSNPQTSTRARAHPLFKQDLCVWISNSRRRGRKTRRDDRRSMSRLGSTQGEWALTDHATLLFKCWWITLFRAGGLPLCPLGPASSAACQPVRLLKRYLNVCLQQCAHSMTSLFVKIDYFK